MKYQIFLHRQDDGSYKATVTELPKLTTSGQTDEEALCAIKAALIAQQPSQTIEFAPPLYDNSRLAKYAGIFQDDPTWEAYQAEIARYRRELDEAEQELLEEAA